MEQRIQSDPPRKAEPVDLSSPSSGHAPLSVGAFVLMLAGLMSVNALATDVMLPAFPDIAVALGGIEITRMQTIITAYMLGFGLSQLVVGFLADRFGRRPVLLGGLAIYSAAGLLMAGADDFSMLLATRFVQGFGSGAPRVVAQAAIRDCYEGRRMARIMSLVMTVFMAVPVLAPSLGQLILLVSSWRWVFGSLAIVGIALMLVSALYFPETLPLARRRAISWPAVGAALRSVFLNRQTAGYTLAAGTFFGALFGFIGSVQPVMVDLFGFGLWFPLVFAVLALAMSASSFVNASLVERFGMRVLSHWATTGYSLISAAMFALALFGRLDAWTFLPMMAVNMLLVGLVFSNFNALAMEPQGHVAGVASSFVSAVTVVLGATIGFVIGDNYDGTIVPLSAGFAGCGLSTLVILFITERGRLFRPHGARHR
ncbi:MAG: Bcr/CflA family drug resistance efflux transporter [Alphaproteobacteria bacterium]|nr:MAG: Bcr/CflA family drug resistance efflux transporter [Alphaproteobacteria bacterium]